MFDFLGLFDMSDLLDVLDMAMPIARRGVSAQVVGVSIGLGFEHVIK
jgi:hypothetical protein